MGYPPGGDDDDPFITLFDIAAISMVCVFLCVPLIMLGSMLIGFTEMVVLIVLFYGAYYFALRGSQ